jgi:putative sigma-54 modulation protein
MQLSVTGRHVEVTDPLRQYALGKVERLSRHFEHVLDGHVTLSVEKLVHRAECTLNLSGKTLHADAEGQDVYAAIDVLVDKLDRQLLKHKEKLTERRN